MTLIRFTGSTPRSEAPYTGRGTRWWPGECRNVDPRIALQLRAASVGWEDETVGGAPSLLDPTQTAAVQALVSGAGILPASNYTYESSGAFRLIGYTRGGIAHSITYPTSTTALITSAQGYQRSITLDASGRTVGVV